MSDGKIVVAVKAVIQRGGKILVIRRSASDEVGAGTWETPGGKIEFGEEPEEALIREVKEEVGLDIRVERLLYVTSLMTSPTRQVIILAYDCRSENEDVHLSAEHADHLWATHEELQRLLPPEILADFARSCLDSHSPRVQSPR